MLKVPRVSARNMAEAGAASRKAVTRVRWMPQASVVHMEVESAASRKAVARGRWVRQSFV